MTLIPDKLAKIRKKADDAQGGYSGVREIDYARDVAVLLRELDNCKIAFDSVMNCSVDRKNDFDLLTKQLQQLTAANNHLHEQLRISKEAQELWKRDCEEAQMQVRELENLRNIGVVLDTVLPDERETAMRRAADEGTVTPLVECKPKEVE